MCLFIISVLFLSVFTLQGHASNQGLTKQSSFFLDSITDGEIDFELLQASFDGDFEKVSMLLEKGAEVNASSHEGVTPLLFAIQNNDSELVELLLENGADVDAYPDNGITALIMAAWSGLPDITELLISKGTDLNLPDHFGVTPLMYAASNNFLLITDLLLLFGADPDFQDIYGNSALSLAVYYGNIEIVSILIDYRAGINISDSNGLTPIMIAVGEGYFDIANLLIENHSSLNIRSDYGLSAFDIAVQRGDSSMVQLFIDQGVNVSEPISLSLKPLNLATNRNIKALLKENGARGSVLPYFEFFTINADINFSANDFMPGLKLGMIDTKYNTMLNAGYMGRVVNNRILYKDGNNDYFQFWENRRNFYIQLTKGFVIYRKSAVSYSSIGLSLKAAYTYGDYRGADQKPFPGYLIMPGCQLNIVSNFLIYGFYYEYADYGLPEFTPNHFGLTLGLRFRLNKSKQYQKSIEWDE